MVKESTVDDYFKEEKELNNSSFNDKYFANLRKCNRYHYTDKKGAIGILKSKNLRLMHYAGLNDKTEGSFILGRLKDDLIDFEEKYNILTKHLYIGSFCLYGNLLSQWCRYGDVSIGFDYDKIQSYKLIKQDNGELAQPDTSGIQFSPCTYITYNGEDFNNQVEIAIKNLKSFDLNSPIAQQQYKFLSCGYFFTLKHKGFEEEHENRIYAHQWTRQPFKHKGKKYVEFEFETECIKRIVIGPSEDQDKNYNDIKKFLNENTEYGHVELVKSLIPYVAKKERNIIEKIKRLI